MPFKPHVAVKIDSNLKTFHGESNTASDFFINLADTQIHFHPKKQYFMRFEQIHIPASFYNINSNNNKIYFVENNGADEDLKITIPPSNYTATELATELESLLDTNTNQTNNYGVSFDDKSGLFTISASGGSSSITVKSGDADSTANDIFGFEIDGTDGVFSGAPLSYTSPYHINLQQINSIDINTNISAHNYYDSKGKRTSIGMFLPVDEERGVYINKKNDNGFLSKINNLDAIDTIHIYFTYELEGVKYPLDFNGKEVKFLIAIYEWNE